VPLVRHYGIDTNNASHVPRAENLRSRSRANDVLLDLRFADLEYRISDRKSDLKIVFGTRYRNRNLKTIPETTLENRF